MGTNSKPLYFQMKVLNQPVTSHNAPENIDDANIRINAKAKIPLSPDQDAYG